MSNEAASLSLTTATLEVSAVCNSLQPARSYLLYFPTALFVCVSISITLLTGCAGDPEAGDARAASSETAVSPGKSAAGGAAPVPGQLMLRFKDSVAPADAETVLDEEGLTILTRYNDPRMFHVGLPEGVNVEEGVRRLSARADIDFAEPNQIMTTQEGGK